MKAMCRASWYPKDHDYGWMVMRAGHCEICPSPSALQHYPENMHHIYVSVERDLDVYRPHLCIYITGPDVHWPHLCICITGPRCEPATYMHLCNETWMC